MSDDIFSDFESKVKSDGAGKPDREKPKKENTFDEQNLSEEEKIKQKYHEEKEALKEKYQDKLVRLQEKKASGNPVSAASRITNAERIAYISLIAILLIAAIYFGFFRGSEQAAYSSDSSENEQLNEAPAAAAETQAAETAQAKNETPKEEAKPAAENKTEENKTAAKEEEAPKLSGSIILSIDSIAVEVSETDGDLGYIPQIIFTIENGKNKVLKPLADVYIYDDEIAEDWETKSRGQYKYDSGIKPGESKTGIISVTPKSFRNLNLEKHVRLALNDTDTGFITAVNKEIMIE